MIYAGGAPSDSEVVDDDGRVVAGSNLPEPGFFVALPTKLAAELREKVGSTGLQEGKIDLSGLLEFRRGDEKGWQLEKFDADGYSLARGSFLYRLVPPEEGQAPVRMQFYDGQDYIVASDFDISQALHKEYAMSIYPGGETGSEVRAVVKVGEKEKTYSLGFAPGRLITRAETAAILNRALGRTPGTGELPDWAEGWTDVPADAWYDGDMLEAALSHRFTWTETPDGRAELWAALERYGPDALK